MSWTFGPAEPHWMEEGVTGDAWSYIIDYDIDPHDIMFRQAHSLLNLLNAFKVVSYGAFYEGFYQIRIKV